MKAEILANKVRQLVRDHHEAFTDDLMNFKVPGLTNDIDYFTYVHMVSRIFDDYDAGQRHELRRWSTQQWNTAIDKKYDEVWGQPRPDMPDASVTFDLEKPTIDQLGTVDVSRAPEWLAPNEVRAYDSAYARAGSYARGLGERLADNLGNHVLEVWDGEEIVTEADAELRQERIEQIREATAGAVARHDDPERLALELMQKTDDWEHNWERVARTEIQGAYNEGRIMSAIDNYGREARIAKVTETGACDHCIRLHRDENGNPKIFTLEELFANGTNVGKTKRSWLATAWPVHPNCRCDTVVVPPGMVVGEYGELRLPEEL